jgi:phage terminase large subunit-like protein
MTNTTKPLIPTAVLERELAKRSLMSFIPWVNKDKGYIAPRHFELYVKELERAATEQVFLVMHGPPRSKKSDTALGAIAWYLFNNPKKRIAYITYSGTFAGSQALKAQEMAEKAGVVPSKRIANLNEWQTQEGGFLVSVGWGGPLMGKGFNVMLIDDLISSPEEADSPIIQEKQRTWFFEACLARLEPGGSIIFLMHRWRVNDLAGQIIRKFPGKYKILRYPALADNLDHTGRAELPDPAGRKLGEALEPSRYGVDYYLDKKKDDPFAFSALYQGIPVGKEEQLFPDPPFYTKLPDNYMRKFGADWAYTTNTKNDSTAIVMMGQLGKYWYVLRVWKYRVQIAEGIRKAKSVQDLYMGRFAVEDGGPQKAINDTFEAGGVKLSRFDAKYNQKDKRAKASKLIQAWQAGLVLVPDPSIFPEAAEWLPDYLEVMNNFTGIADSEDDVVDATSAAFNSFSSVVIDDTDDGKNLLPEQEFRPRLMKGGY